MAVIVALGAEKQAATSLALAYPEHEVRLVSDQQIVDGWDLSNAVMISASLADIEAVTAGSDHVVPLCPRWLPAAADLSLTQCLHRLSADLGDRILPVESRPPDQGSFIVKGDAWHRPDMPVMGPMEQIRDVVDDHGCGLAYQGHVAAEETILVTGYVSAADSVRLGAVHVLEERFFRDAVLQAGETVEAPAIIDSSLEVLDLLDHRGFFSLNWVLVGGEHRLTSVRPVSRAVFQSFRRAGADILDRSGGVSVARAGIRFIADPHYASYRRLVR